jgi:hypothetical protein
MSKDPERLQAVVLPAEDWDKIWDALLGSANDMLNAIRSKHVPDYVAPRLHDAYNELMRLAKAVESFQRADVVAKPKEPPA